jgi:hypothetical protein
MHFKGTKRFYIEKKTVLKFNYLDLPRLESIHYISTTMNKITYLFFALFCLAFGTTANAQIVINEVLASNTTISEDEDGTYQDWVELYNAGASAVNLNGYGLTDDATLPFKWTFPAVSMPSHSYLLIWCSDKNRTIVGQQLHTNWKISSGGETITLTAPGGTTADSAPPAALPSNISWGRIPNATGPFMYIQAVTPIAANGAVGYNEILSPPTFSQAGGFTTAGFALTLSTAVPGASIIYTVDGSEPVSTNLAGTNYQYRNQYIFEAGDTNGPLLTKNYQTLSYAAPINIVNRTSQANDISMISTTFDNDPFYLPSYNIFKGTVVRARVVKPGALPSEIVTNTYFVFPEGAAKFGVPVISLSTNEDRLFDYEDGIFVAGKDFDDWRTANPTDDPTYEEEGNFEREGVEFEKRTHFSYFVNGVEEINQDMGIRVRGGHSRTFPSKSMSLYAREDYGDGDFDYSFFNDNPYNSFERLVLRNGGGDFYGSTFRDDLNQRACAFLHCEYESSQPAVAFLNGEYWGILNVREKYDNNYFQQVYGFDDIDLLQNSGDETDEGDLVHWNALTTYMQTHNLISDSEYNYILTQLDPESFADYYIANIYMDNVDWPGTNTTFWRKRVPYTANAPYGADGRWRWAFHDMDDTLSITSESINHNNLADATATNGPEWPNPPASTLFLRKMLNNTNFKNYFINRFADLINSHFKSERLVGILADFQTIVEPEMEDHYPRWSTLEGMTDFDWVMNTETDFFNQRPATQRNHIRSKFGITSNINATLNVSDVAHGYVKINTIEIKDGTPGIAAQPYPWTGVYFSNIPVTLKAIANPGFVFSHWTGASTATTDQITITSASAFSVTAVFIPETVASSEPIYFWYMDTNIPNDTPLTALATTFEAESIDGNIAYTSSLPGYPYTSADPLWRHGSMERRNKPTPINYIPEANGGAAYVAASMRGLQITEPLQSGSLENTMVFNFSTAGYEDIKFSFAAMNELTNATGMSIDYATNAGTPAWTTAGLTSSTLPLNAVFELSEVDFSSITAADNNENFKVRLRFTGANMEVDNGNRITFNNIAVHGTATELGTPGNELIKLTVFPNPTSGVLSIGGTNGEVTFNVYSMEGRLIKAGKLNPSAQLSIEELNTGLYLLQLTSEGRTETKKIIKK